MPPARIAPIRPGVDLEALQKMVEPLAVHVMRARGSNKENIPMEVREGQIAGGVGWTIGDVLKIDDEIIRIAGGGVYEVQVTDASQPVNALKWSFMVPPDAYPMRTPSTLTPLPYASGHTPPSTWGSPGWSLPPAPSAVPPFNGGAQQLGGWSAGGWGGPQAVPFGARTAIGGAPPAAAPDTAAAMQLTQLNNEIHRRDMMVLEERHRHEREMDQLQRQAATAQAAAAAPKADPRAEALERQLAEAKHQQAELMARLEREAAERRAKDEREAAERRSDDRMRQLEAQLAADRAAANDKFNALMAQLQAQAAAKPVGPDPMIMMLMESQRAAAETAREQARIEAETTRETARLRADAERANAQAQIEAARISSEAQQKLVTTVQTMMAPNQMSPLDAARMMREATQGSDQFAKTIIGNANDMMEMTRSFMSNMLQMAPQGEGVAGRVVGAIENAVQTWTQSQAQVETARAHATRPMPQGPGPQWGPPPGGPPPGDNLNGPQAQLQPQSSAAPDAPPADVTVGDPAADSTLRNGKTDAQWFGPALRDVNNLREGVLVYLQAAAASEATLRDDIPGEPITIVDPATGKPLGVSPLNAARYLVMAANEIRKKNIPGVEAFNYFFEQQMYHALVSIVLPNAPEEYRNSMLLFLNRILTGEALVTENDEPMYGIDKFLDDEDDEEPAPAPAAAAKKKGGR